MSLTTRRNGTGRIYVRKFDHEEATRRRQAGERVADLAAEYGVATTRIYQIATPESKQRQTDYHKKWRTGICEVCAGPAMRLVGGKKEHNPDGRTLCRSCRSIDRRERLRFDNAGSLISVRCVMVHCANGERWQRADQFVGGSKFKDVREEGIHSQCRACRREAKRRYRAAHPEYNARQNEARRRRYTESA